MGKVSRWCLLTCFGLAGCASITAGPELPRPAQAAGAVTLAAPDPTTTTTMDPAEAMATQCPTELCLVYSLRRGAVWSDGTPVTVDDFIRTASYMAAPLSGAPDIYQSIVAIEPIDGERFRVSLTGEFGDWPQLFQRVLPPGYGGGDVGGHRDRRAGPTGPPA